MDAARGRRVLRVRHKGRRHLDGRVALVAAAVAFALYRAGRCCIMLGELERAGGLACPQALLVVGELKGVELRKLFEYWPGDAKKTINFV